MEIGKKADISIFDLSSLNTATLHDPIKSIVYSSNQNNVRDVIINGKFILKRRKFLDQNENDVIKNSQFLGEELVRNLNVN